MKNKYCIQWLIIVITVASFKAQAFVSVGEVEDLNCDYSFEEFQTALDSGDADIRVSQGSMSIGNFAVPATVSSIKGGYLDCDSANQDIPGSNQTQIIPHQGGNPNSGAFNFSSTQGPYDITVSNFNLSFTSPIRQVMGIEGRGFEIDAEGVFRIVDTNITNNLFFLGGGTGILMTSPTNNRADQTVILQNVNLSENVNRLYGGGIACEDSTLIIDGHTLFQNNQAISNDFFLDGNGGAIYADNCSVTVYAGNQERTAGFVSNKSSNAGGAIAAFESDLHLIGQSYPVDNVYSTPKEPVLLFDNVSDFDGDGSGRGGAIYVDNSQMVANGIWMDFNRGGITTETASNRGGAIHIENGSNVQIDRDFTKPCWRSGPCNLISNNENVPVLVKRTDSVLSLKHTELTGNATEFTALIYLINSSLANFGDGPFVTLEHNIIHHNNLNQRSVIRAFTSSDTSFRMSLDMSNNTISDNGDINAVVDITTTDVDLTMAANIINETANLNPLINLNSDTTTLTTDVQCLLVNDDTGINFSIDNLIEADPGFVNSTLGDYHLLPSSPAIDACDLGEPALSRRDMDNEGMPFDEPSVENSEGITDMGADEYHELSDIIFTDSFEDC